MDEVQQQNWAENYRRLLVTVRAPSSAEPSYVIDLIKTKVHRELVREAAEHLQIIVDLHEQIDALKAELRRRGQA